jgi:hypothetical protein
VEVPTTGVVTGPDTEFPLLERAVTSCTVVIGLGILCGSSVAVIVTKTVEVYTEVISTVTSLAPEPPVMNAVLLELEVSPGPDTPLPSLGSVRLVLVTQLEMYEVTFGYAVEAGTHTAKVLVMVCSSIVNTSSKYIVVCSGLCSHGAAVKMAPDLEVVGGARSVELATVVFHPMSTGLNLE